MSHSSHHHHHGNGGRPLKITLGIVLVIMVVEAVGGFISNSLALLSDAGHMLTDAMALVLSLIAIRLAARPATARRTFGFHRAEIMAALANGVILVLISAWIFYEGVRRFSEPQEINTPVMLVVASIGLVANVAGLLILRRSARSSLNVRAAFWHIIGDTLSSVGVIVAGIIILFTGWTIVDPILAMVISCVILWGAFRIVKEAVNVLLESVPAHLSLEDVVNAVEALPGVAGLHDVHIWTITSGVYAFSAHVIVEDRMVSESASVVIAINELLLNKFSISHTTLQLECNSCSNEVACTLLSGRHTDE